MNCTSKWRSAEDRTNSIQLISVQLNSFHITSVQSNSILFSSFSCLSPSLTYFLVCLSCAIVSLFSHFQLPSVLSLSVLTLLHSPIFLTYTITNKRAFLHFKRQETMKEIRRVVGVQKDGLKEWETILQGTFNYWNSPHFKSLSKSAHLDKTNLLLNGSGFWTLSWKKCLLLFLSSFFWWMCYISTKRD